MKEYLRRKKDRDKFLKIRFSHVDRHRNGFCHKIAPLRRRRVSYYTTGRIFEDAYIGTKYPFMVVGDDDSGDGGGGGGFCLSKESYIINIHSSNAL